jgi:hypothetical protein
MLSYFWHVALWPLDIYQQLCLSLAIANDLQLQGGKDRFLEGNQVVQLQFQLLQT